MLEVGVNLKNFVFVTTESSLYFNGSNHDRASKSHLSLKNNWNRIV